MPHDTIDPRTLTDGPHDVPADAMRISGGPMKFADGDGKEDNSKIPVGVVARSGGIVDHHYYGRCVHDFEGMQLHKETLPIDYLHNDFDVLGYLDRFDVSTGNLVATGALVPFGDADSDRVAEIVHKVKQGVPYEASIFFSGPIRWEFLEQDASAEVNGQTVDGPCYIFREWSLRGVAICPYGYDRNTETRFSRDGETVAVEFVTHTLSEEGAMPVDKKKTPDTRAELKKFTDAFGTENGVAWFTEEKSFDEAQKLHFDAIAADNAKLTEQVETLGAGLKTAAEEVTKLGAKCDALGAEKEALEKQVAEWTDKHAALEKKLAAFDRGDDTPASFGGSGQDGDSSTTSQFASKVGDNLGRLADSIKMPGATD